MGMSISLLYLIFFFNAWKKIHNDDTDRVTEEKCCECSE